jgi:predicted Zn-dependent peptidase
MKDLSQELFIEPHSKKEHEYCKKHDLQLVRLDNGIKIIGIGRKIKDEAWGSINWNFESIPAHEKIPGVNHFLEHFYNKTIREKARTNGVHLNAETWVRFTREIATGPANINVQGYGLWQILTPIRKCLEDPLKTANASNETIEKERKIIESEINERLASHDLRVDRFWRKTILSEKNPSQYEVTGTLESLQKIDKKALEKTRDKSLTSKALLVSLISDGEIKIRTKIVKTLISLYKDYPNRNKKWRGLDISTFSKCNKEYKQGNLYKENTHLKNNLINITYSWLMDADDFSPKEFALYRLNSILGIKFFESIRKRGISYSPQTQIQKIGQSKAILFMKMDIKKTNSYEELATKIYKEIIVPEVFPSLTKNVLKNICNVEGLRQMAVPISAQERLNLAIEGLDDYRKIIDADKIKEIHKKVTVNHLNQLKEEISQTLPATLIVGDLE